MGLQHRKPLAFSCDTAGAGTEEMSGEQQEGEQIDSAGLAVLSVSEGRGRLMAVHKDKKADSSLQWTGGG